MAQFKMTGKRFLVSGGKFLENTYLGYEKPGGLPILTFVCDSGQYWADEVEYNLGKNWLFLCDDDFRFFFIKKTDVNVKKEAGNHLYPNTKEESDNDGK